MGESIIEKMPRILDFVNALLAGYRKRRSCIAGGLAKPRSTDRLEQLRIEEEPNPVGVGTANLGREQQDQADALKV